MSGNHSTAEQLAIAAREDYARAKAIWQSRYDVWKAGGRQGPPPPYPVPPHIPGPGNADLVFVDQLRDNAPDEFNEMREMVKTLPLREQLRLSKLPPNRFRKEARRIIQKYEAIRSANPDELLGPNARRRAERQREVLADVADDVIGGFAKALLEHRHGPEPEIVSREEYERRRKSDV